MNWLPEMKVLENYDIVFSSNYKTGDYLVKFKLIERSQEFNQYIHIGIGVPYLDSQQFTCIGKVFITSTLKI